MENIANLSVYLYTEVVLMKIGGSLTRIRGCPTYLPYIELSRKICNHKDNNRRSVRANCTNTKRGRSVWRCVCASSQQSSMMNEYQVR